MLDVSERNLSFRFSRDVLLLTRTSGHIICTIVGLYPFVLRMLCHTKHFLSRLWYRTHPPPSCSTASATVLSSYKSYMYSHALSCTLKFSQGRFKIVLPPHTLPRNPQILTYLGCVCPGHPFTSLVRLSISRGRCSSGPVNILAGV